jgi:hypothetical protein
MPYRWENQIVIRRPIDEVWAIFADLFNTPRLPGGSMALRQTSPGPMGLGSVLEGRRLFLGFETRIRQEIVDWDPPRLFGAMIVTRAFSARERFTLEAGPAGTICTDVVEITLPRPMKLIGPLIEPFLRRQRTAQFRRVKAILEGGFQ